MLLKMAAAHAAEMSGANFNSRPQPKSPHKTFKRYLCYILTLEHNQCHYIFNYITIHKRWNVTIYVCNVRMQAMCVHKSTPNSTGKKILMKLKMKLPYISSIPMSSPVLLLISRSLSLSAPRRLVTIHHQRIIIPWYHQLSNRVFLHFLYTVTERHHSVLPYFSNCVTEDAHILNFNSNVTRCYTFFTR